MKEEILYKREDVEKVLDTFIGHFNEFTIYRIKDRMRKNIKPVNIREENRMSILIKGMKIPEDCRDCPMEIYYVNCGETRCRANDRILATDYKTIPFDGRPEWCPLEESEELE